MEPLELKLSNEELKHDFYIACLSRELSLIGRKEVLAGRAKFGIFGDGKELAQIVLARYFKPGDWRSGYYRDQTWMLHVGLIDADAFFAQLYADPYHDLCSSGRQMNAHFASTYYDHGKWLSQTDQVNVGADLSPTAGQMAKLLGFAYASKYYKAQSGIPKSELFSNQGQEVAFGSIGDASTSEGVFWETMNAASVLQVPMVMSVWDDGYGISVPKKYQTTHGSISQALAGFAYADHSGLHLHRVFGWDYEGLHRVYRKAVETARSEHQPSLVHVEELTQPQGHSTSGSHERYKDPERLLFEKEKDCIRVFRSYLLQHEILVEDAAAEIEKKAQQDAQDAKEKAWERMQTPIQELRSTFEQAGGPELARSLQSLPVLNRKAVLSTVFKESLQLSDPKERDRLLDLYQQESKQLRALYDSYLFAQEGTFEGVEPVFGDEAEWVEGAVIVRRNFAKLMERDPRIFVIGEDVGHLGGVNTEFEGLSERFGEHRVTDTGIREASIFGQGLGAAMRGLRPIVDIQYLDYVLYCLQPMSDDLASLAYRTGGRQVAPVIVRTKGHRLEGIWHTGSPIGMILHAVRGMYVCMPRNMVQAAGMYNTLIEQDNPAFICEVLNGYRVKEKCPQNLGEFKVPLGEPEVLREGADLSIVTYGACCRIALEAANLLLEVGIDAEVIDVQTLVPFDGEKRILKSVQKTHGVLFLDEDVRGGASAYMMDQVLNKQNAWSYLDLQPQCLTAADHRGAYGTDGDYFSKPNAEQIFQVVYEMLKERDPWQLQLF